MAVFSVFVAAGFIRAGHVAVVPEIQTINDPDTVDSYRVHVATDKPIYRTGERVYVRGVVLRENGYSPLPSSYTRKGMASFEIKGPKGDTVYSGMSAIIDSVVGFAWEVPANQPGGQYAVRVSLPGGDTPAERKFDIRAYRAPRLKSQIVFVRDGYGPGDTVGATLHVERAEGGAPAGAKVSVSARIDGKEAWNGTIIVDPSGNASASFKLPAEISRGEGLIAMTIEDGGIIETATKTIPILLQTLDLAVYPEGGDLVAGLPNRVYIECRTPAGKPADTAGVIVSSAGRQVARFRAEHEGRGRFSFVPGKDETYALRVTEPAGIKTVFPMPSVKQSGVIISSALDVIPSGENVLVHVAATIEGTYGVALSQRGKELAFKRASLKANERTDIAFAVPKSVDGVIVATIYDDRKFPRAERLLFRRPEHRLKVKIGPDRADYVPGDKVTLRVTTTDDTGKPVSAIVGLTVTDSSVLEMIEKREHAPRLPVMVLLENEVRDLADAQVYLDESNPKAPLATDLLLGTQGWRRFATAGTGSLSGIVTDPTRAVIAGVTVEAKNTSTGARFRTVTTERGAYAFNVQSGVYRISAYLPGFQKQTVTGLRLTSNSGVRQDLQLNVAAVQEEVAVFKRVEVPLALAAAVHAGQKEFEAEDAKVLLDRELDARNNALLDAGAQQALALPRNAIGALRRRDALEMARAPSILTVREYAHTRRPDWTEDSRSDFAETVYWNAGIRTDNSGSGTVSFNLSDSITSFRVLADAFDDHGTLGSGVGDVESVKPFSIEPKMPLYVTSGDVIELPIGIVNGVNRELRGVQLTVKGPDGIKLRLVDGKPTALGPKERARRFVQMEVDREFAGTAGITIDAQAGPYHDRVARTLDVQPPGFPREISTGGILERNGNKSFAFEIPGNIVRGSLVSKITIYPTPLATLTDALQSLLHEPNGCFEQTSSTSYPMVMAQQYFLSHAGVDPALVEKAGKLLEVSYKKLTGFETPTKGYEWFGADPGHEALTAYGLMQFTDMSRVRAVDKDMLDRTRAWLLSHRDGNGGFRRNSRALDSFGGAPADTTNAYIVWALIESGEKGLDKEIASVKASASTTQDSYIVALGANILDAAGDHAGARQLMEKLARNQEASGNVKGAVTSITRSGGDSLAVETTALSVLAWMREPSFAPNVEEGLKWIVESNKSGRFGSTQSTILALRTIVAYDSAHARPKTPGRILLALDGKTIGSPAAFAANTQGALTMPDVSRELGTGNHNLVLKMENGSAMPFAVTVRYHSLLPESAENAQVGIQVALKDRQLQEGGVTEAIVSIANRSDQVLPTPVAIVGIPGGLEARQDQLKELVKSGKIDAYEVVGQEIVLYWRHLSPKAQFDLPVSLVAAVPGSYTGPASRAYLYYTDELKNWAPGLSVSIRQR